MNEDITQKVIDYLDNRLSPEERAQFESELLHSPSLAKEVEAYRQLFGDIESEPDAVPSEALKDTFLNMLEVEQKNQGKVVAMKPRSWSRYNWVAKIAASVVILLSVYYLGRYSMTTESEQQMATIEEKNEDAKEMVLLALLENQSASKRIQGANSTHEMSDLDEQIIEALANRLRFDDNTNVRLAALEALGRSIHSKKVVDIFIQALEEEKNPSIQIALIHYLAGIQEKKAAAPMQKLLELEETQPFIKEEIKTVLPKIS
ncbi:MAG: HEAT repeat domain-containing protein [Flavobacteriaceae bacterium]